MNANDAGPIRSLLERISAEVGDRPDLVKQAFEDANALDRQNLRAGFDARIEYSRLIGEALLSREAAVKEYGLQTLKWAFLLNAGAIALLAAYLGARTGGRPLVSVQSFAPIFSAFWPFALGCVLVVVAGAAGYYNFSYSTWLLPSYEEMHNFYSPTSTNWPPPRGKLPNEELPDFAARINSKLQLSQRVAVAACAGSMICLVFGLWRFVASAS